MQQIKFLKGDFEIIESPVRRIGPFGLLPGQNQDGYGRKISTDRMVKLPNDDRLRRVFAICFSNVASHYIVLNGERVFLRDSQL